MFHIHAPEPVVGRTSFLDVDFVDGVAQVDELHPERAKALTLHGYTVIEEIVGTPLEDLTVPELHAVAKEEGIEVRPKAKKADIIAAIEAAPVRVLTAADAEDAIVIPPADALAQYPGGGIAVPARPLAEPEGAGEAYIPLKPTEE